MFSKHIQRTSLCILLGGFLLFNFQNCAPADAGTASGLDGEVRIVDRWAQGKVQFMAQSYLVDPDVGSVNIRGLCDRANRSVQWETTRSDAQGELLLGEGEVECIDGSFNVEVAVTAVELSNCNDSMELRASVSNEEALTQLRLACL